MGCDVLGMLSKYWGVFLLNLNWPEVHGEGWGTKVAKRLPKRLLKLSVLGTPFMGISNTLGNTYSP